LGQNDSEVKLEQVQLAAEHYRRFMEVIGLPLNEETDDTPYRVARMFLNEFCSFNGGAPPVAKFRRRDYDEYVVSNDIEFSSLCEHHHMPFTGTICVGYHPNEWLAGLSKIPRVVRHFASRPQLQEHLVTEIAEYLFQELEPHAIMVVAKAWHSCVSCRGVRSTRNQTVTSKIIQAEDHGMDKAEMLVLMGLK
jgi:GTP cyclohydrolase I